MSLCTCMSAPIYAEHVDSVIIFGDSLSDNGNVTHLLQTLRKEKKASYIEAPFRNYLQRTIEEQADKLHLSKTITHWGQSLVSLVADKIFAPMVVEIISKVKKMPLLPMSPYWHYHFTNGKVWNEYLAVSLGLSPQDTTQYENHAFGGSWAVTDDKQTTFWDMVRAPKKTLINMIEGKLIPPSLGLAVESYLLDVGKAKPKGLYFLLSGGNDYLNALGFKSNDNTEHVEKYANNVVHGVLSAARKLLDAGASKMVVFGVPDVSTTPHFNQMAHRESLAHAVKYHNRMLDEGIAALQSRYPTKKITFINMQLLLQELIDNPFEHGMTDTEHACIDLPLPSVKGAPKEFPQNLVLQNAVQRSGQIFSQCEQPEQYVFWDEVHPTTRAHEVLADRVCSILKTSNYEIYCARS